jgi:hypothetical protein
MLIAPSSPLPLKTLVNPSNPLTKTPIKVFAVGGYITMVSFPKDMGCPVQQLWKQQNTYHSLPTIGKFVNYQSFGCLNVI